jgi:aerobic carbon-monoxide dehydrogenase large subunit
MRSFGIGQPVSRKEDPRFLTGRGRYVADLDLPRQGYAVFLFSPHAHARIRSIAIAAAAGVPGVYAVLTGQDWAQDGLGTIDPEVMPEDMGGPKGHRTRRPPLASGSRSLSPRAKRRRATPPSSSRSITNPCRWSSMRRTR